MNGLPALLLVEDDAISREFLLHALTGLPAEVSPAASCAEALDLAGGRRFDLWLIDAHLPDGRGDRLLQRLRAQADTPALALTADDRPEQLERLRRAGFADVAHKPLTAKRLRRVARRLLPERGTADWDPAGALAATGGNADIAARLKRLFLHDLDDQRRAIERALDEGDLDEVGRLLHRLKAACGFVGASRLQAACRALDDAPDDLALREAFVRACRALND